jgi:ABC-type dipeptide/oligopeptide/nickel transport system permease component
VPKVLAALTLLLFAMPAIVLALWWAALCSRFLHRMPAGDPWETQLSGRRAAQLVVVALLVGGCAAIAWGWLQVVTSQLDTFGLRPIVEWAVTTLSSP